MADEFDIYGDDTFGSEIQSDDILGEIVGESTTTTREAKRRKTNTGPEDDLFEDFGEIDKETKTSPIENRSSSSSQPPSRQYAPSTIIPKHIKSEPTKAESGQRQQIPQKIPSSVQSYSSNSRSTTDSPSSTSSRRELPISMSNLRGIAPHPTNAMYIGELAWYVTDEDVKAPLIEAGLGGELKDLTFFEHKVNGKSRGICFLEFTSSESAAKAKDVFDKCEIDGKTPNVSFTTTSNPFKHTPKEPIPKSQRVPQRETRMNSNSGPQMMGGNFNPMMGGGFNPGFANMGMNPYGGFNPMAAAAARGGFFDNMMGMSGGGGRGGRGAVRGAGQPPQYMGRMGGRGGPMMGGGNMQGNGGMYINPAFFDQQQQGGTGNNA